MSRKLPCSQLTCYIIPVTIKGRISRKRTSQFIFPGKFTVSLLLSSTKYSHYLTCRRGNRVLFTLPQSYFRPGTCPFLSLCCTTKRTLQWDLIPSPFMSVIQDRQKYCRHHHPSLAPIPPPFSTSPVFEYSESPSPSRPITPTTYTPSPTVTTNLHLLVFGLPWGTRKPDYDYKGLWSLKW